MIRSYLREIIYKNLETSLNKSDLPLNRLIIAFKRQKNMKELLSPSKLHLPKDLSIGSPGASGFLGRARVPWRGWSRVRSQQSRALQSNVKQGKAKQSNAKQFKAM